jgi:hypothetical protein
MVLWLNSQIASLRLGQEHFHRLVALQPYRPTALVPLFHKDKPKHKSLTKPVSTNASQSAAMHRMLRPRFARREKLQETSAFAAPLRSLRTLNGQSSRMLLKKPRVNLITKRSARPLTKMVAQEPHPPTFVFLHALLPELGRTEVAGYQVENTGPQI